MKNNEPAFPCTFYDRDSTGEYQPREQYSGMSLRDYFAAKAMQGMLASNTTGKAIEFSETAYRVADAMLEARDK